MKKSLGPKPLLNPFLFAPGSKEYYGVGEFLGNAFSVGRDIPAGAVEL